MFSSFLEALLFLNGVYLSDIYITSNVDMHLKFGKVVVAFEVMFF